MIDKWLYRRKAKALLQSEYQYTVDDLQDDVLDDICADARALNLCPAEAAAMFIEVACHALVQPHGESSQEFIERMAFCLLRAMNAGNAAPDNFIRAARLYLFAKGAPAERLDEVDELVISLPKAMFSARPGGLVIDGEAALERLLKMAVEIGLVPKDAHDEEFEPA